MLDCHLHVVDSDRIVADTTGNPSGAWWNTVDSRPGAVVDRLRSAGVNGGVFVQAVGAHGLDDNSVVLAAAATHDGFVAMVTVDPYGPDPVEAVDPDASGLRLFSIGDPWLGTPVARDLLERCAELDITPSICCLPDELSSVRPLLDQAGVEVALDHAGLVSIGGEDDELVALADHGALVVKLSTTVFDRATLDPAATVDRLIDLVGADRVAWGSDHPQINDRWYTQLVELAERATAHLPDAQRTAILGGTTARLWPTPPRTG